MFESGFQDKRFYIREVEGEAEFHTIEDLQKEAWNFSDLDIVPAATLIATRHAGGTVLAAFEDDQMIGFAYAFPAFEAGRASMHSHMLAVKPEYRNFQVGFNLKLAQRKITLDLGLDEISWTFDPLQSLNAHFNFAKLGVTSRRYLVNFYGEATSSPLHQGFGTDRLWVRWLLNSDRVSRIIGQRAPSDSNDLSLEALLARSLVYAEGERPQNGDRISLSSDSCAIEIPHNINALKQRDPQAGVAWREATRAAFLEAIDAGFEVSAFLRQNEQSSPRWFYLLNPYGRPTVAAPLANS